MITIRTIDGKTETISGAKEVIPYTGLFVSPLVQAPFVALVYYHEQVLPVMGPLPNAWDTNARYEERPWILVCETHAQVIFGLPEFAVKANTDAEPMDTSNSLSA